MPYNKRESIFLRISFFLSFALLVFGLLIATNFLSTLHLKTKTVNQQPQEVKIIRVVDGDTVVTENNQKIRLIGIDTPEVTNSNPQKCLGDLATVKMKELVEGKNVVLEKDVSETDKYNRLLRYVWINNRLVNEILVLEGYAKVDTVNPDTKYKQKFTDAQNQAKNQQLGLWNKSNCTMIK